MKNQCLSQITTMDNCRRCKREMDNMGVNHMDFCSKCDNYYAELNKGDLDIPLIELSPIEISWSDTSSTKGNYKNCYVDYLIG